MTLYHYTDQNGFMGIFINQELWATKIQYLNDEKEYALALTLAKEHLEDLIEEAKTHQERALITKLNYYIDIIPNIKNMNICVSSLTENGDLLSQWRGYSRTLGGYSIGFNEFAFEPFITLQGFELAQCVYENNAQKELVKSMIDQVIDEFNSEPEPGYKMETYYESGNEFLDRLAKIAPLLKDSSFAEECEWRVIATVNFEDLEFRAGNSMLTPFYKVNLDSVDFSRLIDEIIVGHTPHPELAISATEAFVLKHFPPLDKDDYQCPIKVKQSNIPFRNW
ncbi:MULTISPECIES: DUF2971 domain-containing protein [unclassified Pseudoalteromonas]|uniref:DUF2971 domain-containing protein n=1 Tax=unclassified Pseudoalteromonas TaxID=194690 RepID=UPI00110A31D5|nr:MULTISPECIES: DUF2971 domain-containing protein [unclassified Pseudoalteromonas]